MPTDAAEREQKPSLAWIMPSREEEKPTLRRISHYSLTLIMWHDTIFPKFPKFLNLSNLLHSCALLKISKQVVKKLSKSVDNLYEKLMIKVDNFLCRKTVKKATAWRWDMVVHNQIFMQKIIKSYHHDIQLFQPLNWL